MPAVARRSDGRGIGGWLARNSWLLTTLNIASGCCFLLGSCLFFFAAYAFAGTVSWLVGSVLMIMDGACNGMLRHGAARRLVDD